MNVVEQFQLPGLDVALSRVEAALRREVTTEDRFLGEVAGHLVSAGGKRLRPVLVLAAAAAAGADGSTDGCSDPSDAVVLGAVAVELVHLGSLYHDDVLDGAAQRRGVESVNARWGNLVAVLAGDFLLARASEIAASLGTEVAGLLAHTIAELCEGELNQLQQAYNPDRSEEAYLRAVSGKTASLMATSARIGALAAGAQRQAVDSVTTFGRCFGMTFQIWDDIRDLVATADELGKPAGHDMVEGTYTLPVLRALASPDVGAELRSLLGAPLDGPAREKARSLILGTSALHGAAREGRRWADLAAEALEPLRRAGNRLASELAGAGHRLMDDLDLNA